MDGVLGEFGVEVQRLRVPVGAVNSRLSGLDHRAPRLLGETKKDLEAGITPSPLPIHRRFAHRVTSTVYDHSRHRPKRRQPL